MLKKLLFTIILLCSAVANATLAPVLECNGSGVDYTFDKTVLITGTIKNSAKQVVEDATVEFYLPSGEFVSRSTTDATGKYALQLAPNAYIISATDANGARVWSGNAPRDKASRVVLKIKSTANLTLDNTRPVIDYVDFITVESKKGNVPGYRVQGTGFGTVRGYIDVAGYLSNSTSYIASWNDNTIVFIKNTSMPTSGCFKVFSKYAGYSDCSPIPQPS